MIISKNNVHTEIEWFEDLTVGQCFESDPWLMEREEIISFARMYDPEPFHLDEQAAIQRGWGGLIASGLQVAAICRRLQTATFPNVHNVISPGWDEIRWFRPVFAGDRLSCRSEVVATRRLESRPGEGLVKIENQMINQQGEVAAGLISNVFMLCRPRDE